MKRLILGLLLLSVPAAAQAMNVAEFLAKANALEKKGAMAMFSGDLKLLKNEIQTAGKAVRAEQVAAQKGGRKPATCMPKSVSLNDKDILSHFRAIPPDQRGASVKTAFAGMMRKKYPCPA